MSYDPYSSAMRRVMEDLELARRIAGTVPDAVQQVQREWKAKQELFRQMEDRQDVIQRIAERQDFLRQLEERNRIVRAAEEGQKFQKQIGGLPDIAALSGLLYQNRPTVNSYIFDTFYGAGTASLGSFGGSSFIEDNEELAKSYEEVSEFLDSEEEGESMPQELRALPTTEAFTSAEVVEELALEPAAESGENSEEEAEGREERRGIRMDIKAEAQQQLRPALQDLDPRLVKLWDGGLQAIASTNPDKVRHFTVSLRELTREVMHRLAPDQEVKKWNTDPDLYHQGRPTRKARLQYICRSIDQPVYGDFVTINYKVFMETVEGFNKGTHLSDADFTKEQLDALETRAAQALLFLLRLGSRN
jgi:Predicted pPIWI-associating nuclease